MNKKRSLSPLLVFMIIVILACSGWVLLPKLYFILDSRTRYSRCDSSLPSEDLTAANLIGTWVAGYSDQSDTLILRKDNKYKQIIYVKRANINYQTEWQDWWLEREDNGFVYLHLKGMRMCGVDPMLKSCGDLAYTGYDFCQDKSILMKGQGVLLVLDEQEEGPFAGLRLFFPLGSENVWVYEFQKP